jgi:hypothetical protein
LRYVLRVLLFPALVATALLVATVGQSQADPNLPTIAPHRHFVQLEDGTRIEVGPRLCDNPNNRGVQQAFAQFHVNLHRLEPGAIGPLAPGLHNGTQTELVARGC